MKTLLSAIALASLAATAHAAPLPATWSATGNAGSSATADGNISLAPGDKGFIWVSTAGGLVGEGRLSSVNNSNATNGSSVSSGLFAAQAGDVLSFYFNYLTSDGAGYSDYGWASLVNDAGAETLLFTARTTPGGSTVPGFDMPAPGVTLDPATVMIQAGTSFSGIGGSSGSCWSTGCGHTGWVKADFVVVTGGNYRLNAGVTNWSDQSYDTALAIADVTIGGISIDPTVPEPASLALVGLALVGAGVARRRRA